MGTSYIYVWIRVIRWLKFVQQSHWIVPPLYTSLHLLQCDLFGEKMYIWKENEMHSHIWKTYSSNAFLAQINIKAQQHEIEDVCGVWFPYHIVWVSLAIEPIVDGLIFESWARANIFRKKLSSNAIIAWKCSKTDHKRLFIRKRSS